MRPAGALFLGFLLFGCHRAQDAPLPNGATKAEFHVEGMTCEGCESGVKAALEKLDGVQQAEVSHRKERTWVTYDPARVSAGELEAAIESAGYRASLEGGL